MLTNDGRFRFALPSAYETQAPSVGWSNWRPRCPVVVSITAGKWFPSLHHIERTTAILSTTPPTLGNQSETGIPDLPYRVNVRRHGITGRFISATLSPNPMASISLPAHLLSFGSNVSIWLMPPHMNRKMTDLACGVKCGPKAALGIFPSSDQSAPRAAPKNPPPAWKRKRRRAILPHGYRLL